MIKRFIISVCLLSPALQADNNVVHYWHKINDSRITSAMKAVGATVLAYYAAVEAWPHGVAVGNYFLGSHGTVLKHGQEIVLELVTGQDAAGVPIHQRTAATIVDNNFSFPLERSVTAFGMGYFSYLLGSYALRNAKHALAIEAEKKEPVAETVAK